MALRQIQGAIPRLSTQLSRQVIRCPSAFAARSCLRNGLRPLKSGRPALFSTARIAFASAGHVDQELSIKLQSELELEKQSRDTDTIDPALSEYITESPFELHDTPGHEEVVLTRKFGNESIRVSFSIADLADMEGRDDEYDPAMDENLIDEDEDEEIGSPQEDPENAQSQGGNAKGTQAKGLTQDGNVKMGSSKQSSGESMASTSGLDPKGDEKDAEEADAEYDGEEPANFPVRVKVMIEKPGKGTLQVDTTALEGGINVDDIFYHDKGQLTDASSAESEYKRRNVYEGPPFMNLDDDLQVLIERYLDERGINAALAVWVPEYVEYKEQKEYLTWLANVKSFVDT